MAVGAAASKQPPPPQQEHLPGARAPEGKDVGVAAADGLAGGDAGATARHTCSHCGLSFGSRNGLFAHLQAGCDPAAREGSQSTRTKEQVVLLVGYLGSRYSGCMRADAAEEATRPTVAGAVAAAARRAWGDVVSGISELTRTEKGVHAAENVFFLTLRPGERSASALSRELECSEIWLLAAPCPPTLPVARLSVVDRRSFRVYVPYSALLCRTLDDGWLGAAGEDERVWVSNLPHSFTAAEVVSLCARVGVAVEASGVVMVAGSTGNAEVAVDGAGDLERLCAALDGVPLCEDGRPLLARPLGEAQAKLRVLERLREGLRRLRGPEKGVRSFHNFVPGAKHGDTHVLRALKNCAVGLRGDLRLAAGAVGWWEADFATVTVAAKSFAPHQLQHMVGALVAVVRGVEEPSYIDRGFDPEPTPTLAAPAEALCLESATLGSCNGRWRKSLRLDAAAASELQARLEARIAEESRRPWAEFVAKLDAGRTKANLLRDLASAAVAGSLAALQSALQARASPTAADEYGRTALLLAAEWGHCEAVQLLLSARADAAQCAGGGTSALLASAANGHRSVVSLLLEARCDPSSRGAAGATAAQHLAAAAAAGQAHECGHPVAFAGWRLPPLPPTAAAARTGKPQPEVQVVLAHGAEHAGAGTLAVDHAVPEAFLRKLDELWRELPRAARDKASPTERAYFADAEGLLAAHLAPALAAAGAAAAATGGPPACRCQQPPPPLGRARALPGVRFLEYAEPGGALPAHVDLPRTDAASGRRTTFSFLLYLTDCGEGGETLVLEALPGDAALAPRGGVAPGSRATLAAVAPRRGRLLLMPHACPHSAAKTVSVPKRLIRGELLLPEEEDTTP